MQVNAAAERLHDNIMRQRPRSGPVRCTASADPGDSGRTSWGTRRGDAAAVAVILAAGLAVYAGSLNGPFVFDDEASIVENSAIRNLCDWRGVLFPPRRGGTTVDGRPWVSLSLA